MNIKEATKYILDGDGLLFLGSGFSLGATNLRNEKFMSGNALARHFNNLTSLPQDTGLEDAAEAFVVDQGVDALIKEVQELFTASEVCDFHSRIADIPWKRVYTTNYDNVFEVASQEKKRRVTPITLGTEIYQIPKDHLNCIHLNGYVHNLDRGKINSELKLTDTSYVTASISDSEWSMLLRQDIKLASVVFFVGYSLHDLDIRRILVETETDLDKIFFIVGPTPGPVLQRRVARYGTALELKTEELAAIVEETASSYTPRDRRTPKFLSIREFSISSTPSQITDQGFRDLLLWGRKSENLVAESLRSDTTYYLNRPEVEDAVNAIEDGARVLVVTSDLGNGKSMFLDGLGVRAIENGYRVFHVFDHNEGVEKELETVARMGEKVVIMIEEYQKWTDEIGLICTNAGDQVVLVLTARNAIHDFSSDDLNVAVGDKVVVEINVDLLKDTDVEWVVNALDQYGLWGQHAGLGRLQKTNRIVERYRRQFHAVLLDVIESPDMEKRLSIIVDRIKSKGVHYEQLLSIFILTLLNHGSTTDILTDIWGAKKVGMAQFRADPIMKEFVDVNYYAVNVRSSVAAEYLLNSVADAGTVVSILTRISQQVERGASFSPRYASLFKDLMRFGTVQTLLPERGKRDAVIQYYETLKTLKSCRNYPLFWLQYAIACVVIDDLPRAETYFDTAYSLAEKRQWDPFQIDNHFARFLMVQAIEEDMEVVDALANYRKAQTIIDRQIKDERRHHPYRVAITFQEFINKYGNKMKRSQVIELASAATRLRLRIDELPQVRSQNKYVRSCRKSMEYVIHVCHELTKRGSEDALSEQDNSDVGE